MTDDCDRCVGLRRDLENAQNEVRAIARGQPENRKCAQREVMETLARVARADFAAQYHDEIRIPLRGLMSTPIGHAFVALVRANEKARWENAWRGEP